ncbi:MAG: hypothetical protein H6738_21265 [Alphaproteobacteria bacterium]|nr:hypothetical protein [Alphaproteobacteria bacterium]MCB9699325.1 hypothetical protein [Alphaproteobacteria bacterium]
MPLPTTIWALVACATGRTTETLAFDGDELAAIRVAVDRGDLTLVGGASEVRLTAEARARAGTRSRAEELADAADLRAEIVGDALVVEATAPDHGWIDLALEVPDGLDLEIALDDGALEGRGLVGGLDAHVRGKGVDLELFPEACALTVLGPVTLSLPFGLDYHLTAITDPAWGADVVDLGFDTFVQTSERVEGSAGRQDVPVDLQVIGGPLLVLEATP